MRFAFPLAPLLFLGLSGCVAVTPAAAPPPTTTYVVPAPPPPSTTYVTPATPYSPSTTTVIQNP
jgi:hypothetical protein